MKIMMRNANQYGELTEERLQRVERQLGVTFPADWRAFLLTYNGGRPAPDEFFISAEQGSDRVRWFLGIHDGPSYTSLESAIATFRDRMPAELMPIGSDPGGNLICIGIRGEHYGQMYFWDHEMEADEDDPPTWENLYPLAPSFAHFVDMLTAAPEPEGELTLAEACRRGDTAGVQQTLAAGADVNSADEYGHTLLDNACIGGYLEIAQLLIAAGADLGNSLDIAAQNERADILEYLIQQGADVNKSLGKRRDTSLMIAAAYGRAEIVRLLIRHGANVNTKNRYGQTALRRATWAEHAEIIEILKQAGAR